MSISPSTPVIIGVGQSNDRTDSPTYKAWSAADLAAEAAKAAVADCEASADVLASIDAIATTRTFEHSTPIPAPFGKTSNFPRSVAQRLGIEPPYALWTKAGGNTPQDLVAEFCERIAAGEFSVALITGAEAISTVRHAMSKGITLNFAEEPAGQVDDRGAGLEDFVDPLMLSHGVANPTAAYALAENARRANLGMTREEYSQEMGKLFAPFAAVASTNPYSSWTVPSFKAEELIEIGPNNRWIADPYPLRLVSRDQVNLAAAILITTAGKAREMGVPEERWVYLHGYASAAEKPFLQRPDLGAYPAAVAVSKQALKNADVEPNELAALDFYSCFPIAVSSVAIDELGLSYDDPRHLTVTGGLPFFGGPGNNYSMHAIAEIVQKVRQQKGSKGFVGANGGYLSKYSAGIYSSEPKHWQAQSSSAMKMHLDAVPSTPVVNTYDGEGTIETYTVLHNKGAPSHAVIIGRTPSGMRFIARSARDDQATILEAHSKECLERKVAVQSGNNINTFKFV